MIRSLIFQNKHKSTGQGPSASHRRCCIKRDLSRRKASWITCMWRKSWAFKVESPFFSGMLKMWTLSTIKGIGQFNWLSLVCCLNGPSLESLFPVHGAMENVYFFSFVSGEGINWKQFCKHVRGCHWCVNITVQQAQPLAFSCIFSSNTSNPIFLQ